ncbi:ABC transporter ATP-binding protein [Psychrobacillus sp. PGGUH221]|uniref:ABC transporter ATP-binding protein n=1 Tax=Psychrobacillus sp. PGGUH221 TaxID=3020058 RepID=UPI0035C672DD
MNEVIKITNLSREYVTKTEINYAVKNVSFSVNEGEIFGLLGPNGAGKSTIIKILSTLLSPTSGSAEVLGYDTLKEDKKIRPHINFVYGGERNLYWRLTARENLNYFADLYKIDKKIKKRRVDDLLQLVGLNNQGDKRVETFSKGMKQKLQIARGLINNPKILFLDEPTIGLDPISAKELRNIVKDLASQGTTVLITTHYMEEADEVCDRIAIINKGEIKVLDSPENLKKNMDTYSTIEIQLSKDSLKEDIILENNDVIEVIEKEIDENTIELNIKCYRPYENINNITSQLNNLSILSLTIKNTSLEDVYIHYVKEVEQYV